MSTSSGLVGRYAPTLVTLGAVRFDRIACLVVVLVNGESDAEE